MKMHMSALFRSFNLTTPENICSVTEMLSVLTAFATRQRQSYLEESAKLGVLKIFRKTYEGVGPAAWEPSTIRIIFNISSIELCSRNAGHASQAGLA